MIARDLTIEFETPNPGTDHEAVVADSADLGMSWEALCEGVTAANVVLAAQHPEIFDQPGPVYEPPREGRGRVNQRVATGPVIVRRGKATCVEWACWRCAVMRIEGDPGAIVRLVQVVNPEYETADPYSYHALVVTGRGEVLDVTAELPGAYSDPWWMHCGYCCENCGLDGLLTACDACRIAGLA